MGAATSARRYRVTVRSLRFTVEVEAEDEERAVDQAIERARWDAEFEETDVTMTRGEPDPPDPPPLPDVAWVPEPARSHILESAPAWDSYTNRVWSVLIHDALWATNGHWAFKLPEGTPTPEAPAAPSDATKALGPDIAAATELVPRAREAQEMGDSSYREEKAMVYTCGEHWPLSATYVDLLEKLAGADAWYRQPGVPADPAVLRDSNGEAVALLMPRRAG